MGLLAEELTTWEVICLVFVAILGLAALGFVFMFLRYFKLWLRGFVTKAGISPPTLVFMALRNVNPHVIMDARIMAVQAGLTDVTPQGLEAHYLSGGNVRRIVQSLIASHRAKIDLKSNTEANSGKRRQRKN